MRWSGLKLSSLRMLSTVLPFRLRRASRNDERIEFNVLTYLQPGEAEDEEGSGARLVRRRYGLPLAPGAQAEQRALARVYLRRAARLEQVCGEHPEHAADGR